MGMKESARVQSYFVLQVRLPYLVSACPFVSVNTFVRQFCNRQHRGMSLFWFQYSLYSCHHFDANLMTYHGESGCAT
jgi:hypothetical protein